MQSNMNTTTDKSKSTNGKWSQAQKDVESNIDTMSETARKVYDQAVEAGSDFIAQANKRASAVVKDYPVSAVLGGVCAGLLIGATLFGRRAPKEG